MSIGSSLPFSPAGTVSLAATTASASQQLAGGGETMLVTNATNSLAFVRFGADPGVVATFADLPILPGNRALIKVNSLISYAAGVLSVGAGSIYFTRGEGSVI